LTCKNEHIGQLYFKVHFFENERHRNVRDPEWENPNTIIKTVVVGHLILE
jgi:hypothetical protein